MHAFTFAPKQQPLTREQTLYQTLSPSEQAIYPKLKELADRYALQLQDQIDSRIQEMKQDDTSHYLIYNTLGISNENGEQIDIYQNIGRFLYNYAGDFLEAAAFACFQYAHPEAQKIKIANPAYAKNDRRSGRKTYEIDCLVGQDAHELKWRDATTDGDHVNKEELRVRAIKSYGFTPIRVMFFEPQREQAQAIQQNLSSLYQEVGGRYYSGPDAWQYIKAYTGVDLHAILNCINATRNL